MIHFRRGLALTSLAAFAAAQLSAAPAIGVVSTRGVMEVDKAAVRGTTKISDGSSVRTGDMAGRVELNNGVRATLAKATAARVHADRIELSAGAGQVSTRTGFDLDALGFRISPESRDAVARVTYENANRILVTAVDSPLKVSRGGTMLARLTPGTTYYFEPAAEGEPNPPASNAGNQGGSKPGAKAALSTRAKWGIALGAAAAAAGTGIGIALSQGGGSPLSSR